MIAPQEPREAPRFQDNPDLLSPDARAPLPLAPNPRPVLQGIFRAILLRGGAPQEIVEPAATAGGGMVHACQEFVLGSNGLISRPREELAEATRTVLWASRDLLGARHTAYALHQAVESVMGARWRESRPSFVRLKNFMEPIERRFEELGLPVRMDPVRFAVLQVHLDEAYDAAGLLLQLFYLALKKKESVDDFFFFAKELASMVVRNMIPDQILNLGAGPGREHTGLLDLLPELEREFI